MSVTEAHDLKSSVKEKYGQAALRASEGKTDPSCCGSTACCGSTSQTFDPITSNPKPREVLPRLCSLRLDAETRQRLRSSRKATLSSTWARAAESTCFSRR